MDIYNAFSISGMYYKNRLPPVKLGGVKTRLLLEGNGQKIWILILDLGTLIPL